MTTSLSFCKFRLGSLTGTYLSDLNKTKIIISPKCPIAKVIFRGSNCSYAYKKIGSL